MSTNNESSFEFFADSQDCAYELNEYVFVKGDRGKDEGYEYWIAKLLRLENNLATVQWTYRPEDLPPELQDQYTFGKEELLMTSQKCSRQKVSLATLAGKATVSENCFKKQGHYWTRMFYPKPLVVIDIASAYNEDVGRACSNEAARLSTAERRYDSTMSQICFTKSTRDTADDTTDDDYIQEEENEEDVSSA